MLFVILARKIKFLIDFLYNFEQLDSLGYKTNLIK